MWRIIAVLAALVVTACAPVTQRPQISAEQSAREKEIQDELSAKQFVGLVERINNVYYPIRKSNTDLCGKNVAYEAGFVSAKTGDIPKDLKKAYEKVYGLEKERPVIVTIMANSPAEGHLQVKDRIVSINGVQSSKLSDDESLSLPLPWVFEVLRDGQTQTVEITPDLVCKYPATAELSSEPNAYANGKIIVVSSGMVNFVQSDDELALVISHELAHSAMEHHQKKNDNATIGLIFGLLLGNARLGEQIGRNAYSQSFESEADYVGTYYAARAGYNIDNAPMLWRRMGANNPASIHATERSSHPSTAARFLAIEQTVQEIKDKQTNGLPLEPNLEPKDETPPQPQKLNNMSS